MTRFFISISVRVSAYLHRRTEGSVLPNMTPLGGGGSNACMKEIKSYPVDPVDPVDPVKDMKSLLIVQLLQIGHDL
jgi:hypothetical protein